MKLFHKCFIFFGSLSKYREIVFIKQNTKINLELLNATFIKLASKCKITFLSEFIQLSHISLYILYN